MKKKVRQIFITGLAVTIPIGLTLYVLFFIIGMVDRLLDVLPRPYHPDTLLQVHIPGLGVIATIILILLAGVMMKSYVGNKLIRLWEGLFHRIPVIRSVYEGTKQIVDSMFVSKSRSFQKVVLVAFPHPGSYTLGFVTGPTGKTLGQRVGQTCVNVLVPTTPNPTSGYLLMVPEKDLVDIDMTVEEAFTHIISCGIVHGPAQDKSETG